MIHYRRFVVRFAVLALPVGLLVWGIWPSARADLPVSVSTLVYQPDFEEWAFVRLMAEYRDTGSESHFVTVGRETKNGRLRFKIIGGYANTPVGNAWYNNVGSKIPAAVEAECKYWTGFGFACSLKDFQIDITQAGAKPQ